jgi:hypothetical protein
VCRFGAVSFARVVVQNNEMCVLPFKTATHKVKRPSSAGPFGSYNPVSDVWCRKLARHVLCAGSGSFALLSV